MPIEIIVGAASTALDLFQIIKIAKNKLIDPKKDDFLNYSAGYLLGIYGGESHIMHNIPYTEIVSLYPVRLPIKINVKRQHYSSFSKNQEWARVSSQGYAKLLESKRVYANENIIRLDNYELKNNEILLTLQIADYHDQCKTNLILDFLPKEEEPISLRRMMRIEHGNLLPKLRDRRLANTVGIACLLFFMHDGKYIPYMVKRVKKVGVFPGGIHCTASGAAKWPQNTILNSFEEYFTDHMFAEIKEEVGLDKPDIDELIPISICREYARGGKPQIFYAGITNLSRDDLVKKRQLAVKVIKETDLWPEVEKEKWYKSGLVFEANSLADSIKKHKITLEGVAALHFGIKYLDLRLGYKCR